MENFDFQLWAFVLIALGVLFILWGVNDQIKKQAGGSHVKKNERMVRWVAPSHPNCRSRMLPDAGLGDRSADQASDYNGDGIEGNG